MTAEHNTSSIYLDANATARLRPVVGEVVSELLAEGAPRNPSSVHGVGRKARARLQKARQQVLKLVAGSEADKSLKVVFTSGGTEACNSLVFGFLGSQPLLGKYPGQIVTTAIEHPAILEPLKTLAEVGWEIVKVAPNGEGEFTPEMFVEVCKGQTALVLVMGANNETGAILPVAEIAKALRESGYQGPLVSDCTQLLGKSEVSVKSFFNAGVTAVVLSGHKLGAPAGIGAMVISEGRGESCFSFTPLLRGGPQEGYFRAGTENLFGAMALGAVCDEVAKTLSLSVSARRAKRERLWQICSAVPGIERISPVDEVNPDGRINERAICNTLLLRAPGCRGDDLVVAMDIEGVAISTGSACASGKQGVSHVVLALGFSENAAREIVRLSIDWDTTAEDIEEAGKRFVRVANRILSLSAGSEKSLSLAGELS